MTVLKSLFLGAAMMAACAVSSVASPDVKFYEPRDLIQVSTDDVQLAYNQTSKTVFVTAKSAYELYCRCPWLKVVEQDGKITVTAEPNESFVPRTGRIILTTKKENVSRVISVTQNPEPGHDKYFALPKEGNILPLADLDLSKATHDNYIKEIKKNKSIDGKEIRIKNNRYESAIATHAKSVFNIKLNGAMRFVTDLGIDDGILSRSPENHGDAVYKILLDGKEVASGRITILDKEAAHVDINTHGAQMMQIVLDTNGSNWGDHIDLGNPYFELTADKPELVDVE